MNHNAFWTELQTSGGAGRSECPDPARATTTVGTYRASMRRPMGVRSRRPDGWAKRYPLFTASLKESDTTYSEDFAEAHVTAISAHIVVPLVLKYFPVNSVVDVGCGVGTWLREFEQHGVSDYLGLDGADVPTHLLDIPVSRFRAMDLGRLTDVGRSFDLAVCLEVGEHLPENCAKQLVSALVHAAPIVLFSAAVPGQTGTCHINEQWQSYWARLFAHHDYKCVDCIRPFIFGDERVQWWYRQNAVIYCQPARCPEGFEPITSAYDLDRVHPAMFSLHHVQRQPARQLTDRELLGTLFRVMYRKLGSWRAKNGRRTRRGDVS
jgi:hypothetical protein